MSFYSELRSSAIVAPHLWVLWVTIACIFANGLLRFLAYLNKLALCHDNCDKICASNKCAAKRFVVFIAAGLIIGLQMLIYYAVQGSTNMLARRYEALWSEFYNAFTNQTEKGAEPI